MSEQQCDTPNPFGHWALRVEEASLNAWPALHQQLYDGWLLRFSRGFTKRANSVNPLYPAHVGDTCAAGTEARPLQLLDKIRYCENLYAREDQPTVFRITSLPDNRALESALDQRGYTSSGLSLVLLAELPATLHANPASGASTDVATQIVPAMDDWLDGYCQIAELPTLARSLHQAILRGIHGQLGFAQRSASGIVRCCGLGVLEAELVGLFDIISAPSARRRGHARALVLDLLAWAKQSQARFAYLQVAADNAPAIALYRQLGFTELYRYWYRTSV